MTDHTTPKLCVCEDCGNPLNLAGDQMGKPEWVGWSIRREGPYLMCPMCVHHSVRNRGAFSHPDKATAQFHVTYAPEFENGALVKVNGHRIEYLDGNVMIDLIKALGAAVPTVNTRGRA
jgi:hypothetical protein